MICASEQAVILDEPIYDAAMAEFAKLHAHLATPAEKQLLEQFLFGVAAREAATAARRSSTPPPSASPRCGSPNRPASPSPTDTSIILAEVSTASAGTSR